MEINGEVAPGYEAVRDAFDAAHRHDPGGSQLCVYRDGERVVDLWIGTDMGSGRAETADTLHVLMSTTKGAVAIVAAMLAERGILDVERPVGEVWPEYAVAGKERTTIAQLLTHTSGLPTFRGEPRVIAADLPDWDFCTRALAASAPFFEPGSAFSYQGYTYGFLVGEVIRRVAGMSAAAYFDEHIARPLGLDFWIGLPADRLGDVTFQAARTSADYLDLTALAKGRAGMQPTDPAAEEFSASWGALGLRFLDGFLTSPAGRTCEPGAVNGISTARSVAKMYAAMLGEVDGIRLLSAEGLAAAVRPRNVGIPEWKPYDAPDYPGMGNYGLGFHLLHPLGASGTAATFGTGGAGGILGYASAGTGVALGYTSSAMNNSVFPDPRHTFLTALAAAGLI